MEFRLEADNQQHQRELDQAVLKERFKWESILALEKQQKSNQIQDKQVEILQQQLQTERKEKSRLEADNLILVERLRQNMNRKNSVKVHNSSMLILGCGSRDWCLDSITASCHWYAANTMGLDFWKRFKESLHSRLHVNYTPIVGDLVNLFV